MEYEDLYSRYSKEEAIWQIVQMAKNEVNDFIAEKVFPDESNEPVKDAAISLLKEYEQWEADLINDNELWCPNVDKDAIRGKTYDTMLELQEKRNQLLKGVPAKEDDKDLIIYGLEEGSDNWKAEYDNCRSILQELVDLKIMKDKLYYGNQCKYEYESRKLLAWEYAKKFLESYQHLNF